MTSEALERMRLSVRMAELTGDALASPVRTADPRALLAALDKAGEEITALRGAISWVEPPFVDADTIAEEIRKRVQFLLADAARATPTQGEGK